jgi:hypothetical protein
MKKFSFFSQCNFLLPQRSFFPAGLLAKQLFG